MVVAQPPNVQASARKEVETETGAQQPTVSAEQEWDEERLKKAMSTLKEMHIQLRNLRSTLPRLIAPLTVKQPSPETMFREFSASVRTANSEVEQFRQLWTSEDGTTVLEQAKKSRAERPSGIRPWMVTEHSDWLTRDT